MRQGLFFCHHLRLAGFSAGAVNFRDRTKGSGLRVLTTRSRPCFSRCGCCASCCGRGRHRLAFSATICVWPVALGQGCPVAANSVVGASALGASSCRRCNNRLHRQRPQPRPLFRCWVFSATTCAFEASQQSPVSEVSAADSCIRILCTNCCLPVQVLSRSVRRVLAIASRRSATTSNLGRSASQHTQLAQPQRKTRPAARAPANSAHVGTRHPLPICCWPYS